MFQPYQENRSRYQMEIKSYITINKKTPFLMRFSFTNRISFYSVLCNQMSYVILVHKINV